MTPEIIENYFWDAGFEADASGPLHYQPKARKIKILTCKSFMSAT